MLSRCKQISYLSLLVIYVVIYFIFLTTKHGRIFVYTIYGDKEAIDKIRIEPNDTRIAFVIGIGLVLIGFILLSFISNSICRQN